MEGGSRSPFCHSSAFSENPSQVTVCALRCFSKRNIQDICKGRKQRELEMEWEGSMEKESLSSANMQIK